MAFEVTDKTKIALDGVNKEPNYVLEIDGVSTLFGGVAIKAPIRIGDPGLLIGGFNIGGLRDIVDQSSYIQFQDTSTQIRQQLDIDKARSSSISSMRVRLLDKDQDISELISPGFLLTDPLSVNVRVYMGFADLAWRDDYIVIFRGKIAEIGSGPGFVDLSLQTSEKKSKTKLLEKVSTALDGAISDSVLSITVDDGDGIQPGPVDVGGFTDTDFKAYVRIDDELLAVTARTGNVLTVARGEIFTTAVAHADDAPVNTVYRFQGNNIITALKIMSSKTSDPTFSYLENLDITNFVRIDPATPVVNAVFFDDINLEQRFGIFIGDSYTITGANNAANNIGGTISDIVVVQGGSYFVGIPDSGTYVDELDSPATISFRSQFATFPVGLGLTNEEIDVKEFDRLFQLFLSSFLIDVPVKDTIDDMREFIERNLLFPSGAYSLPRKSKNSVGFHFPPIPGVDLKILNETNILNPDKLKIKRSLTKNFYNEIEFLYDEGWITDDLERTKLLESTASKARIDAGDRPLKIEAPGVRQLLGGANQLQISGQRMLDRYEFAAEYIPRIELNLRVGFTLEVGDIVLLDGTNLQITDSFTGKRGKAPRFYYIENKVLDIVKSKVIIDAVDTGFSIDARYGLISPASKIQSSSSEKTFIIKPSFNDTFGINEFKKWTNLEGASILVRSADSATIGTAILQTINFNEITLETDLGFVPPEDFIMALDDYDNQNDLVKLLYTFMSDVVFADGGSQYLMI